jgi:hypothetical protein
VTCDFIYAKDLKKLFQVRGHFYDVLVGGKRVPCRSVLEIVRAAPLGHGPTTDPDAIVVMMNPGGSKPLSSVPDLADHTQLWSTQKKLVLTKPDVTQYQIMRVMYFCRWNYVRVLNLSDLREASSASFVKQYRVLEQKHEYMKHSIFSTARAAELSTHLKRSTGAPIISAWGTSPQLAPLIGRCARRIRKHGDFIGLPHHEGEDRYLHPLPHLQIDKRAWVDSMVDLIRTTR